MLITFPKCAFKDAVYDCLRWINRIDAHQSPSTFRRSESHDLMQRRKQNLLWLFWIARAKNIYHYISKLSDTVPTPDIRHFSPTTKVFCKLIAFKKPLWFAQWLQLPFLFFFFCIKFPRSVWNGNAALLTFYELLLQYLDFSFKPNSQLG